ncbi:MAG: 50S ribosomal protein L9 [Chlamydiae bacterium]|nr:50S ribosomal protein L9 [Chlamydiota bacterium]
MQNQLLLLEDVDSLARKGEIVKVKPGFARNYLLPQGKAVVADKRTLRMQEKLVAERAKQAVEDKKESMDLAAQINHKAFNIVVKVDPDGHMYGSVTALDISKLLKEKGFNVERHFVKLLNPIKTLGVYEIQLVLKENVEAQIALEVESDIPLPHLKKKAKKEAEAAPVENLETTES